MNRYFKLSTTWDHYPWVQALSAEAQNVWIKLQCYVASHGVGGRATALTPAYAARIWMVGEESVKQCLIAAELHKQLDVEDEDWVLLFWRKEQGDPTGAERKRRERERKREQQQSDENVTNGTCVTGVTRDGVTVTHKKKKKNSKEEENSVSSETDAKPASEPFHSVSSTIRLAYQKCGFDTDQVAINKEARRYLKRDSAVQLLVAFAGGIEEAAAMFVWAHSAWQGKVTWEAVFAQRNQIKEKMPREAKREHLWSDEHQRWYYLGDEREIHLMPKTWLPEHLRPEGKRWTPEGYVDA